MYKQKMESKELKKDPWTGQEDIYDQVDDFASEVR